MVFMTQSYNEECYASCENVQMPSTSGPVMDIMCGADNSVTCTADKWFTYMGSILNGYSPFNIFYTYTNSSEETVVDGDKVYIPLDPTIVPCDQPVPDTVIKTAYFWRHFGRLQQQSQQKHRRQQLQWLRR